jgi:gliding motility-associated-like protein
MRNIKLLAAFLLIMNLFHYQSQLVTSVAMSPLNLVQNVLLGPGVTVSNITFNGSASSIGSFNASGTNLGITNGIVMTTGTVLNTGAGPQGPNNQPGAGVDNNAGGSALLTNLINGTQTYNAAILEFDFIPYSDTVRFKYVFGSDEYPEFAPPNSSGFNDVFGFFISGPGITGMQNIAKLPTNGSIVSINNVNAITNSSFYNFNGDGNSPPYNSNPFYIQYDGFTDVLEAVSRVECGETYHLVLAIADVGDGQWDSGIFLEANSLSSQTPIIIDYSISDTLFGTPSIMAEGCVSGTVTLSREDNLNTFLTIPIQITGSATNNIDYSGVPGSVTFAPGDSVVSFDISIIEDALSESQESIILSFLITDPCGNVTPFTITLFIQDVQPISVSINNPIVPCPGDNIVLTATVSGGLTPYSYSWSTGQTTNSISLAPTATGIFSVTVNGQCVNTSAIDTVIVNVPVFQPLQISVSDDITSICPFITEIFEVDAIGGSGIYTFNWTSAGNSIGNSDSIVVTPSTSSTYVVSVTDNCGAQIFDTITYTITSPPLETFLSTFPEICPGDSAYISVSASGGFGNHYYFWPSTGDTVSGIWVTPSQTTFYLVEVSDDCQTFSVPAVSQVIVVKPNADFTYLSSNLTEGLPISILNLTTNGYVYDWFFSDGGTSTLMHPTHIFDSSGLFYVTLIAEDSKGCIDSITKPIFVEKEFYIYIPNTFVPDNDRFNEYFSGSFIGVESVEVYVFNRWGEQIYESKEIEFKWDGTYKGINVPEGTYTWLLKYKRTKGNTKVLSGHINVLR